VALPPGAIGSAVTGRKVSMARDVCKGRFGNCAKPLNAQLSASALSRGLPDDGEMEQDALSEAEALVEGDGSSIVCANV
jgi:hypothetical protein